MATAQRPLRGRFFASDPDDEPFGLKWLRGLTPARVGLVAAVCALYSARSMVVVAFRGRTSALDLAGVLVGSTVELLLLAAPALLLVTVADNVSIDRPTPVRVAILAGAVLVGACLFALMANVEPDPGSLAALGRLRMLLADTAFMVMWGGFLTAALFFLTRERRMAAAAQQARVDRLALAEQMDEARLMMLQAQIEPHFLFNSLANIQGLYREDPQRGRELLKDLSAYLRAALPQMRDTTSTLGRELALSEAYLRVLKVRMGARLSVDTDIAADVRNADMPPMILPTLVENAIKHGIAPKREGGTVRIAAARRGARLRITVSDDGAGFRQASGTGIGLANSRSRLASLYGDEASLRLVANPGAGVTATVEIPYRAVPGARS